MKSQPEAKKVLLHACPLRVVNRLVKENEHLPVTEDFSGRRRGNDSFYVLQKACEYTCYKKNSFHHLFGFGIVVVHVILIFIVRIEPVKFHLLLATLLNTRRIVHYCPLCSFLLLNGIIFPFLPYMYHFPKR